MSEVIKVGLRQMGRNGLTRLKKYIEADKPLCFDGQTMDLNGVP